MAGLGARLYPITKIVPKQLLPILNRPVLEYVLIELMRGGIEKIICVISQSDQLIKQYMSTVFIPTMMKINKDFCSHIEVNFVEQKKPQGLADAILQAEKLVGQQAFVIALPDIIFNPEKKIDLISMLTEFSKRGEQWVGVSPITKKEISNYGIVQCDTGYPAIITGIVEKPPIEKAFSNLGVIGRYIFTPKIFDFIKNVKVNHTGEKNLTNAISELILHEKVYAHIYTAPHYDCGRVDGYLNAILHIAFQKSNLHSIIKSFQLKNKFKP